VHVMVATVTGTDAACYSMSCMTASDRCLKC
jgi:hypothetical protein